MNQLPPSVVIDDYITFLLGDALARIGICPVKTKTSEWLTLMGKSTCAKLQNGCLCDISSFECQQTNKILFKLH